MSELDERARAAAGRIGSALRAVGYTELELATRLGPRWADGSPAQVRAAWLDRLGTDALATTAAFLLLGEAQPVDALAAAGLSPDDLLATGLATDAEGGGLLAVARLTPWFDLFVASDRRDRPTAPDFVLGPSRSGERAADLTVRRQVGRALDLGTGAGIQALLTARHAQHVVGTDVNERALWFAERNAALNGVGNVEWRAGSWFEPVAGETYDLAVCNAPFVVSAEPDALYRDGGMRGDAVSELLVRGLPGVLADGGWGSVLVGWLADPDAPLERPLAWLEASGCGAIILTDRVYSLHEHAEAWAPVQRKGDEAVVALTSWVEGLRSFGYPQVREGAIVLRRGARSWRVTEGLAAERRTPAGAHLERLAEAADFLLDHDGPMLDEPLHVVGTVRLDGSHTLLDGDDDAGMVEVRVLDGLGVMASVDAITARALRLLPDAGTPRVAIRRAALHQGVPVAELASMEADAEPVVRELVRLGVLAVVPQPPAPPVPLVPGALGAAGRVLAELGYHDGPVRELLRQPGSRPLEVGDRDAVLGRVDADLPVHLLTLLFLLDLGMERRGAVRVLGEDRLATLLRAGLLTDGDEGIMATVHLAPYAGLLLASDRAEDDHGWHRVPGVHVATWMADRLTVRRPVGRALDLGTGCGTLALLAARHASSVVATDVNPRAVAYAAANAELNGISNVEVRQGSWYEPVAGERFDLVVSNPPFVISPEHRYQYRDGGTTDAVSRMVVEGLAEHLAPGGDATVLVNWQQPDDPRPAPAAWLDGAPLDAWLLVRAVDDLRTHAQAWNAHHRDDPAAYAERVDFWERALAEAGVERIGKGAVVARHTGGSPGAGTVRTTPVDFDALGSRSGEQIDAMLSAAGRLAELGDDHQRLAEAVASVVPGTTVTQTQVVGGGDDEPPKAQLRVPDGLGLDFRLDPHALPLVWALATPRPLGDAVEEIAGSLGLPLEAVAPAALGLARVLVQLGAVRLH